MFWMRVKALLATARVANVPSVVSNVWVGAVVGSLSGIGEGPGGEIGASVWWLAGAGVCLYVAGNFLNDWYDREWDEKHRPERALPSGLFCPGTYLAVAMGLVVMAGVCAWAVNGVALAVCGTILIFVVAYTVLHKRTAWGVVWVGLCRALLVVLGIFCLVDSEPAWRDCEQWLLLSVLAALPLFVYIVGLSVSARFESLAYPPSWALTSSFLLLGLPILLCVVLQWLLGAIFIIWPFALYLVWMYICYRRRSCIPDFVSGLLAGIPLVDWMLLYPIAMSALGYGEYLAPAVILLPVIAFGAGLLLQRVAPAS
jgi:4-hydroxybenzoate polyprenyltransferase